MSPSEGASSYSDMQTCEARAAATGPSIAFQMGEHDHRELRGQDLGPDKTLPTPGDFNLSVLEPFNEDNAPGTASP